jgi:hypothetical protein
VKHLIILSIFPVHITVCGLAGDRDVRAYNGCLARHPQELVVCDGPRQAYEVDVSDVPAMTASLPTAGYR